MRPTPRFIARVCLCLVLASIPAGAAEDPSPWWLNETLVKAIFPTAIYTGPVEGDPPVVPVYSTGRRIGFVFATSDLVDVVGFSGAPFTFAVGLSSSGDIVGVELVEHAEPIIDYNALREPLRHFMAQYVGLDFGRAIGISGSAGTADIDGISSATVSARAFHHAIIQSARTVARSRGLRSGGAFVATVDTLNFEPLAWSQLMDSGAVRRVVVRGEDVGRPGDEDLITDLHIAMLSPPSIGRSLLGAMRHGNHVATYGPNDLVVLLMANGPYAFVGRQVFDTGVFDRIRIAQGNTEYVLPRQLGRYLYLPFVSADGAPQFDQIGLFRLPASSGIDVLAPWDLILFVGEDAQPASSRAAFKLRYELPRRFILPPVDPAHSQTASPWKDSWRAQTVNIIVLAVALLTLTVVLASIGRLTRRPRLYQTLRIGFLLFALVWIGWIAGAQLSVINPLTWVLAFASGRGWDVLLVDPLLCVLLAFVIVSFITWGRGVFCGWLCPFGALQELLSRLARLASVPQLAPSHRVHGALRPLKYVVLAGLVVASLHAPATLGVAAEVEPFKTVISLKLDRAWPFVLYASIVLLAGLFVERAFCRFLCPLGAIMALGGKLRMFNALERRAACGSPCQLCAKRCPVQAIEPSG
ncbi:MAG: 4Fe-4S binding protein, partial [Gammaproteobacteria bacterium]